MKLTNVNKELIAWIDRKQTAESKSLNVNKLMKFWAKCKQIFLDRKWCFETVCVLPWGCCWSITSGSLFINDSSSLLSTNEVDVAVEDRCSTIEFCDPFGLLSSNFSREFPLKILSCSIFGDEQIVWLLDEDTVEHWKKNVHNG